MLVEVIATNIADVRAAGAYGADRIELVTGIAEGGLTPSLGLIEAAAAVSSIPVQVMVRPHSQSFRYDSADLAVMRRDIAAVRQAGAAGIVIGALDELGAVDVPALDTLLAAAGELDVTFHRAFDEAADQFAALRTLAGYPQIRRILTSGGPNPAPQSVERLAALVAASEGTHLRILAGYGLSAETVADVVRGGGVHEVHFGSAARENGSFALPISRARIQAIRAAVG
ncbi:copper homeostasis protein CutC [Paenibacillus methanolicus]|uniref:PF03932 family protein CutC n=1 Tax=Paenibacillus methanolicus TaxID=582686 RepID=A0A5S5CAT9_9BACL|nr:copper homeostasis protein CutC [Paenibacillus methanolicus]TYP75460.1 copper homeostasis protein [Paenibacillus methanolicus]